MSVKEIPDAGGNKLTTFELDGRLYPTFDIEALRGVSTFKARSDDVIVCAYPKSGTHWVWEMVRLLQAGTTDIPVIEKDDSMIEFTVPKGLEAQPSPRALNTHVHFECLPPEFFTKKVKIIYLTRDPRDVAVSYFNHHKKLTEYYHYDGEWKNYLPIYEEGKVDYDSWFEYTKGWEKGIKDNPDLPVHVSSYEDLHKDTAGEVFKLAKFLEIDGDETFVNKVVEKCSFDVMRNVKGKNETCEKTGSPIMYRKGKVGDWKNWFTVAQSEGYNLMFEEEMRGTDAYQLYSHTVQCLSDANMNSK